MTTTLQCRAYGHRAIFVQCPRIRQWALTAVVPYYKYLRWELETYPLYRLNLSADELLNSLLQILETGDWRAQQRLLREAS